MIGKYLYLIVSMLLFTACQPQPKLNIQNSNSNPKEYVKLHNQLREKYFHAHPLIWSATLERDAQHYANYLAQTGQFRHDPTNQSRKYGENLFAFSRNATPNYAYIIQKWYREGAYYNYETNRCQRGKVCGHYTQIIWKKSQKIGCASAQYKQGRFKNGYVTVCKYYPYGNIIGERPY